VDLVLDDITAASRGIVRIAAAIYADCVVRFPESFAFTETITPLRVRASKEEVPPAKAEAPAEEVRSWTEPEKGNNKRKS
jgi:hypothetical protein